MRNIKHISSDFDEKKKKYIYNINYDSRNEVSNLNIRR